MKLFKHLSILGTVLLFTLTSSCTNNEKEATSVANDFLTSYFSTDYQTAAACCTEEMSKTLMEAVKEYYEMEENLKESVKDISSNVNTIIKNVEEIDKTTIIVHYDMTIPDTEGTIESRLTLKKGENGWRVAQI